MKVFAIEHDGVYLGGYSVVVAESLEQANEMMKEVLTHMKLNTERNYEITEIKTTEPYVHVLWNGDY